MPSVTMQTAIYHINKGLFEENTSTLEIIKSIVLNYNNNLQNKKESFREQQLVEDFDTKGLQVNIFYSEKHRKPQWADFLIPILSNDSKLLKSKNKDNSFVMFVSDEEHLYAVSGGQGNFMIQDYINSNFGLELLTKLISENSQVVKALSERGIAGSILGSQKYFRFDYRLIDDQEFGKLYKQIKAALNPDVLAQKFGFSVNEVKKDVGCIAKSTFKINKSINFDFLLSLMLKITELFNTPANFNVNKIEIINNKGQKNRQLIAELENSLLEKVVNYINNNEYLDVDFCHPEFEKFQIADSYKIFKNYSSISIENDSFPSLDSVSILKDFLIERTDILTLTQEDQIEFIRKIRIKSYDSDNMKLTEGWFLKHLHGEVTFKNNHYFFIDGDWCRVQNTFIEDLNSQCSSIISFANDPLLLTEPWDQQASISENEYNQMYFNKDGFFVFDKVTPHNIEICDILKFDHDTIYLIHVKKGFNNTLRDLAAQIFIASRLIQQVKLSHDYSLIELLYEESVISNPQSEYSKKLIAQANSITKEQFVELFRNRTKVVVGLAFLDSAVAQREITNIQLFDSNIAKFSVIELHKNLRAIDIPLKMVQLAR
ncbi:DUF6119 family protein [Paenibacillus sp. IHBB 3054]|uniref:DUF6119 family protein n=1 Tax=Paenibacillus sp. IHBB 3054 TaxID=3425689 RepID=UPI003F66C39B